MLKKPITGGIILLFLLSSLIPIVTSDSSTLNNIIYADDGRADYTRFQISTDVSSDKDTMLTSSGDDYSYYKYPKVKLLEQYYPKDDDVELLWTTYIEAGEDEEYKYTTLDDIDYLFINDDDVPDILAGMYALDGKTGEIIYKFERGVFLGLGDINNDGHEEIITGNDVDNRIDIYCINPIDGSVIWKQENINNVCIDVIIGDVTGDSANEVVVGMNDVYCFNGIDGSIIWTKHLIDGWICSIAISDVNNDGDNEIIAGTFNNDARVCCLDGDNGDVIWEYKRDWVGFASFRTLCIDNLNDDPYQEIIVEGGAGLLCLSGYDGKILWSWDEEPSIGSFQAILSADIIPDRPGKEIIAGGVGGIYCLYGGDNPPNAGRVIWHTKISFSCV